MATSQRKEIEAAYAAAALILDKMRKVTAACVQEDIGEQQLQVLLDDLQAEVDRSGQKVFDVEDELAIMVGEGGFVLPGGIPSSVLPDCVPGDKVLAERSACVAVVKLAHLVLRLGTRESAEDILLVEEKNPVKAISESMKILGHPDWKLSQPLSYERARAIARLDGETEHREGIEFGLGTLPTWAEKYGKASSTVKSRLTTYNKEHASKPIVPIKHGKKHLFSEEQVREFFPELFE